MAKSEKKPAPGPGLFDQLLQGSAASDAPKEEQALSVTELTRRIKDELGGMGRFAVEGELTRVTRAQSGHVYFQLKDEGASISCIVWRGAVERATAGVRPEEGQKVLVRGKLDVYSPRGGYSLIVERIEPVGIGKQLAELEALKRELQELGWFDRRRPLPAMPRLVGVVTSRDAAALRDFLRTRSLRWPGYPVRIRHTPVQGPAAAREIAVAIDQLSNSGVDVLVVTRGGGSMEDLWCFNERVVAEAIHRSPVPVIAGVGHETDTTLADLVADHRAHTPTDAAAVVIPDRAELVGRIERLAGYLDRAMDERLATCAGRLSAAASARVLARPDWILGTRASELEGLGRRLRLATERRVEGSERRIAELGGRLESAGPRVRVSILAERTRALGQRLLASGPRLTREGERRIELAARALESVSPLKVLARGYSTTVVVEDGTRRGVVAAKDVAEGDELETRLASGVLRSRVTEVREPS